MIMARTYQRKFLQDGTPNPKFKPRSPSWKKQPKGKPRMYRTVTKWDQAMFLGIDGEGVNLPDGRHVYNLLMLSNGASVYKADGLSTDEILNFLYNELNKLPRDTINVVYGGSYDANMWIRDLPKQLVIDIRDKEGREFTQYKDYLIRYMPRKYFSIKKIGDKRACVIWDVIGFFQGSFINTIKSWLHGSDKLDIIKKGKALRSQFDTQSIEFIKEYCQAELDCLVELMHKLREAVGDLDLVLRRWDGAGAVAAAFLKKYQIKQHFEDLPEAVQEASQFAYFGGRIEMGMHGITHDNVYHYDINSAYPSKQKELPALKGGHWQRHEAGYDPRNSINTMIICRVRWDLMRDPVHYYPFPWRQHGTNCVIFQGIGENWLWNPEVEAALNERDSKNRDWDVEILEAWEFIPRDNTKPFKWIQENFDRRKTLVAESKRTGIPNGMEKVIKLGLNSLYGKTVQQKGYQAPQKEGEKLRIPPFHNLAYGGWITSSTRAQLWSAAMQADGDIICLATDGIYSRKPLDLYCPKDKILGAWEFQKHDMMAMVQSGIYWLKDGDKLTSYSRGFDKMSTPEDVQETLDKVIKAWKQKQKSILLPCTRFITLRTALITDEWFERWCSWHEMVNKETGEKGRELKITGTSAKREKVSYSYGFPHKNMILSIPTIDGLTLVGGAIMSQKYAIEWIDNFDNLLSDILIDQEHSESNY